MLVYGTIYLTQRSYPPKARAAALLSLGAWGMLSVVEGALDSLYFAWYYQHLTPALTLEIMMGCLLMNAILFYLPAIVLGVVKDWLQQPSMPNRILVHDGNEECYLAPEDIFYVAGEGNYVRYHTRRGKILSRHTLAALELQLPPSFMRCHRSYIVNIELVDKYAAQSLELAAYKIPVGRTFKPQVKCRLAANV